MPAGSEKLLSVCNHCTVIEEANLDGRVCAPGTKVGGPPLPRGESALAARQMTGD